MLERVLGRVAIHIRAAVLGACAVMALLAFTAGASADEWLPHPADANWQYQWSDNVYNPTGTIENVDVQQQSGNSFTLAWADPNDQIPAAGASPSCTSTSSDVGTITFEDNDEGLINTDWNSCPQPSGSPILCSTATDCPNSLSSALFNVIWGDRQPVLSEPLLQGTIWSATGGAQNDVSSESTYLGLQTVKVPAFPSGVLAAVVQSQIVQDDAIDNTYASGTRTTWWVDGVGPVRVVFDHEGGGFDAYGKPPVTNVELLSTNLVPGHPGSDVDYFPFSQGATARYEWINKKHLPQPEVEKVTDSRVQGRTAELSVASVSGPLKVAGEYLFSDGLDGLTNLAGDSAAASLVRFPALGHGRHFFTPLDFMVYGFNPVLEAYSERGESWKSGNESDFHVFGVTGSSTVIGVEPVSVPAGKFDALVIQSVLTQRGYPFGSGTRTAWFAPKRGLVKLVFDHRDGSVSVIELLK